MTTKPRCLVEKPAWAPIGAGQARRELRRTVGLPAPPCRAGASPTGTAEGSRPDCHRTHYPKGTHST